MKKIKLKEKYSYFDENDRLVTVYEEPKPKNDRRSDDHPIEGEKMKCMNCKDEINEGDYYKEDIHFDDPICENCQDDYKNHLIENELWSDLSEWDEQKEIEFKKTKPKEDK